MYGETEPAAAVTERTAFRQAEKKYKLYKPPSTKGRGSRLAPYLVSFQGSRCPQAHRIRPRSTWSSLAELLQVQGNKGRSEWKELHGKLAEVAAGGDDPTRAVKALLDVAKDASSPPPLMRALERVSQANLKNLVSLVAHELDMTPLADSEPVHIVDKDSNFCKESVDRMVNCSAELSAPDAPYAVISIVGAQSSGKSFLLNHLFGTRFPEMDCLGRRCQTTRGIMMSRCIDPSLILLDVEGFDGKERNQDTLFEKQAALFALTVSDLMMVNIPKMSIGLEQGAANPLFRTIFQERTKLPKGITKILVVLRYYDGEPSIEIMRTQVLESLEETWKSVNEESAIFKDYIEVNVVGLPDKHWPQFPNEVTGLRKLLSNNRSSKYSASSFSVSSSWFWDTIKNNKELDIISHQVALAKLFCREEANNIVNSVKSEEKFKLMSEEDPGHFQEISHELLEEMKNKYDLSTKMYDPDVRDNERQYMVERLHESIKDLSKELIRKAYESTIEQFKHEFCWKDFQNIKVADAFFQNMKHGQSKYVSEFTSTFKDLKLVDTDLLRNTPEELKKKLEAHADQIIKSIKDLSKELIRKAYESTIEQFKHEFCGKDFQNIKDADVFFQNMKHGQSKYVSEFTSTFKDLELVDTDFLRNTLEELQNKLEAHADQTIKIIEDQLIHKAQGHTLEKFKDEFNGKKLKDMEKDAKACISKCVHEFMSSFEDSKLVDSKHLKNIGEELEKNLEAHANMEIKIIEDHSRELIRMAQGHTLEKFKDEVNRKKLKDMEKDANAFISKCVGEFMSSFKDSKLLDSKYLQNFGEELEKNLEAHADMEIKIIKDHFREQIYTSHDQTLEKFKQDFNRKKLKKMKRCAKTGISKYVGQFMRSFEDSKLVDSMYLQNIGEELEKNLQAHADEKIKVHERIAQQKRERRKKVLGISASAVATVVTTCAAVLTFDVVSPAVWAGRLVHSSVDLYKYDAAIAAGTAETDDAAVVKLDVGKPLHSAADLYNHDAATAETQDDAATAETEDDEATAETEDDAATAETEDDAATAETDEEFALEVFFT